MRADTLVNDLKSAHHNLMKKLSKREFEQFKKECLRLQKEWGLLEWDLSFDFRELKNIYSKIYCNLDGMFATIILSSELENEEYKGRDILSIAKHEIIHLLLAKIFGIGTTRFCDEKSFDRAEEEVTRILEKIL